MTIRRLFFTKSNDMDLGYAFVIPFIITALLAFWLAAYRHITVTTTMWSFLSGIIVTLLICTIPIAKARILADSKAVVAAQEGLGQSGGYAPNTWASGDPNAGIL
jgi:hypothetical protein